MTLDEMLAAVREIRKRPQIRDIGQLCDMIEDLIRSLKEKGNG